MSAEEKSAWLSARAGKPPRSRAKLTQEQRAAVFRSNATKHGLRNSKEYRQWCGAKQRCHNPNNKDYVRYGAKGIEMCARWRNSPETFIADMGKCPDGMSLDRIDTNGPYDRHNCRWATATQQQRNKTNGARVTIGDELFDSLTAAAIRFNVSITTINRWCNGFFDARRGTFTPAKEGCIKRAAYS
jgi:hypothetical protein